MDDATPERWLPVVGYESLYEVSSYGQVKSYHRNPPRILRPETTRGYLYLNLCHDGQQEHVAVARLVALAFLGPTPAGMEIRHLDGDSANNVLTNLVYGTHGENEIGQGPSRHPSERRQDSLPTRASVLAGKYPRESARPQKVPHLPARKRTTHARNTKKAKGGSVVTLVLYDSIDVDQIPATRQQLAGT